MRLRFTIRDLPWLTAVVALAIGWWADHRRIQSRLKAIEWQSQLEYTIRPPK